MKILVDADACPVKEIIVRIAKAYQIPVVMLFDTSHTYDDGYSEVFIIDKGRDTVDYALINKLKEQDIVITQDYGVACMALAKKGYCISQNGLVYTNQNIDSLLESRYQNQKLRNANVRVKGPKKRNTEQDEMFERNFVHLIEHVLEELE
jgi:uncharacterized protein